MAMCYSIQNSSILIRSILAIKRERVLKCTYSIFVYSHMITDFDIYIYLFYRKCKFVHWMAFWEYEWNYL